MHQQMRNQEAALAAVAFDAQGRNLNPLDGLQQLRRPAAVPKGVHGVFLQMAYSNSAGAVIEEVSSSLSSTGTRCLAPQLSASGHRENVSIDLRCN
jgi:hypothetical protein